MSPAPGTRRESPHRSLPERSATTVAEAGADDAAAHL
jgi:hypothetical protein